MGGSCTSCLQQADALVDVSLSPDKNLRESLDGLRLAILHQVDLQLRRRVRLLLLGFVLQINFGARQHRKLAQTTRFSRGLVPHERTANRFQDVPRIIAEMS